MLRLGSRSDSNAVSSNVRNVEVQLRRCADQRWMVYIVEDGHPDRRALVLQGPLCRKIGWRVPSGGEWRTKATNYGRAVEEVQTRFNQFRVTGRC